MKHGKTLLIVNPGSGRYSASKVRQVAAELSRLGLAPQLVELRTPQEVAQFFRATNPRTEYPFIIVAAGDGTFNAVLNCIEQGKVTLAVLPLGTANVLAAELGVSSLDDGLCRIARGDARQLPVGHLQLAGGNYIFSLMAGIGLDGAVAREVRPLEKRYLKQGAYALAALRKICSWDREVIEVASGDRSIFCHSVVVCNASRYGGNFVLAPEADLFSPGFGVTCITSCSRAGYLKVGVDVLLKRVDRSRGMIMFASDVVEIRGTKPIQIDGDFVGYAPAKISAIADFARIIV